jgi:ATP-binding cassette subfamily B protein
MSNTTARILVVDDESLPRTLLSTSLRESGFDVVEADSGTDALRQLRASAADVVLLDLIMPDMDGFHVLKEMKADEALRDIPVVVVSGSDDMNSVVRCLEMGAIDHLSKPFDPALLRARVRAALAVRHLESEHSAAPGTGVWTGRMRTRDYEEPHEVVSGQGAGILLFLKRLCHWCRPYRRQVVLFVLLLMLALGIEAALPLGFKYITDNALLSRNLTVLIIVPCILVCAAVMAAVIQVAADGYYVRLAMKILNDLRFNMYRHLQELSIGYFARTSAGVLTSRFTTDLAAVENTVMLCLPLTMGQFMMVVFSLGLLFVLEWKLALFAVFGMYVSYKVEHLVEEPASAADIRMKEQQASITAVLQETINAQTAVKVFRLQKRVTERFKRQMVSFYRTAARACFLAYLTDRIPGRCISLFGFLTITAGAFLAFYGFLTIGDLVAFQVLLSGLTAAVNELTWSIPHLVRAAGGMNKIELLLADKPDVVDAKNAVSLPPPRGEIVFKDVTFGYTPGQVNLDHVSLVIPLGKSVLLTGPSGCGKSTVLNLLLRFYDPRQGSVSIDGYDLKTVTKDSFRQYMSVVLQENFLFDTTVRENIRLARPEATDAEVEAAARAVEMHDIITNLPKGYDTKVGERGSNLSSGQRQLLAIARVILSNAPILLLDEATSSFDAATASSINSALARVSRGRTAIYVTHRLESAPKMDMVVVFKEGHVVESGRHDDLLRRGGTYAQLWRDQVAGQAGAQKV